MKPIVKIPLIYAAIAAVLAVALMVTLFYLDRHPFLIPVYFDNRILLFAIFIFFSLRELRDVHFGGILYFWQGLISSFLFLLFFSVIASACLAIFAWAEPAFVETYISLTIQQIKSLPRDIVDRIGKDVVESNLKTLPATNGFDLVELYSRQSMMIGLFISIIVSVLNRRTPKP